MKKYLLLPLIVSQAMAFEFPNNECAVIIASRETIPEINQYIAEHQLNKNRLRIFKSQNGWYAISTGMVSRNTADKQIAKAKARGQIPDDSFCSSGQKLVSEYYLTNNTPVKNIVNTKVNQRIFNHINANRLDSRYLSQFSKQDLRLLRNYYFAKNGFTFKTGSDLDTFFKKFNWYKPRDLESAYIHEVILSEWEKDNIALILATERGESVETVVTDLKNKHHKATQQSKKTTKEKATPVSPPQETPKEKPKSFKL